MTDTNKSRKKSGGYRQGYLTNALTDKQVLEFLSKHNKIGIRICNKCLKSFKSEGFHNHTCKKCKARQKIVENSSINYDVPVYKTTGKFKVMHHFRGEIE